MKWTKASIDVNSHVRSSSFLYIFVLSSFLSKKSKSIHKNKNKKNLQLEIIYIPTTKNLGQLWEALRFQRIAVLEKAAELNGV